ncbi:MAG TPA: carboxylating nicotinate-nucleotide diphosphorylase [Dehalococcoidia bacterium]
MEIWETPQIKQLIRRAISEDHVRHDVTTKALIPQVQKGKASIIAKANGIIAGTKISKQVFREVDPTLQVAINIQDGSAVKPGDVIAVITGKISSILKAERVALNFMQRLSGIASTTASYVQAVKGLRVQIMDTRKTTPGLRILEKYAVRAGGGKNHRMNLADGLLIKDNHIAAVRSQGLSIKEIVAKAREEASPELTIEIEVKTQDEAAQAADAGANIILLDNMTPEQMRQAVELISGRALTEASGGINMENVRSVAETGVDRISIGALTHSPKALDISLELD